MFLFNSCFSFSASFSSECSFVYIVRMNYLKPNNDFSGLLKKAFVVNVFPNYHFGQQSYSLWALVLLYLLQRNVCSGQLHQCMWSDLYSLQEGILIWATVPLYYPVVSIETYLSRTLIRVKKKLIDNQTSVILTFSFLLK